MKIKTRKAFNFDLDTKKLKEFYPNKHWRMAYKDIKVFLKNENFEHRQGSGYVSKDKLYSYQVVAVVKRLNKACPWLKKCVKHFDVTDIGRQHDLTYLITQGGKNRCKNKKIVPKKIEKETGHYFSFKEVMEATSKPLKEKNPRKHTKSRNRSDDFER